MKNIIGIGIDIIDHKRIKDKRQVWLRYLTKREADLLNSFETDERKVSFAAGRWAAKEAVIKASNGEKISYTNIEVLPSKSSNPQVTVNGKSNYIVSISHEKDKSVAIAINIGG